MEKYIRKEYFMRGCLLTLIIGFLLFMFGGVLLVVLGFALYMLEVLLPVALVVAIVLIIVKAVTGKSLKDIFSSKDKRHRYRRRK